MKHFVPIIFTVDANEFANDIVEYCALFYGNTSNERTSSGTPWPPGAVI